MDKISSFGQLSELMLEVRREKRGFITNFYPDEHIHQAWIETGSLFYEKRGVTIFLLHSCPSYANLFFITPSAEDLRLGLSEAVFPKKELFLEIIGIKEKLASVLETVQDAGFNLFRTLGRMWKPTEKALLPKDGDVEYAEEEDAKDILNLLTRSFDVRVESIPSEQEIGYMIRRNGVLICRSSEKELLGCLLFDRTPSTLHLRFWVTSSSVRGNNVGSRLMHRFLYEGNSSKRQILWVMQDNETAIKIYEHYGFKPDNMYDFIMAKNI